MGTLISTILFTAFTAGVYAASDDKTDAKDGELTKPNRMLIGAAICFTLGYLVRGNNK